MLTRLRNLIARRRKVATIRRQIATGTYDPTGANEVQGIDALAALLIPQVNRESDESHREDQERHRGDWDLRIRRRCKRENRHFPR